jgi:hypothetical protein
VFDVSKMAPWPVVQPDLYAGGRTGSQATRSRRP